MSTNRQLVSALIPLALVIAIAGIIGYGVGVQVGGRPTDERGQGIPRRAGLRGRQAGFGNG